ncbi:hypothetical protein P154DRAFT_524240 [Amniculicola lignicola CBS 123094]|uniref:Uncharacterized protein n=1 Tax=Amniculicola lignicola CBS 123094 TaxID=1392246 RepID=A0A6A5W852_9PLEO|nr:hypothetical protein P154DRAFT_524240 [Amniculicola lignicola CBS 123094]
MAVFWQSPRNGMVHTIHCVQVSISSWWWLSYCCTLALNVLLVREEKLGRGKVDKGGLRGRRDEFQLYGHY